MAKRPANDSTINGIMASHTRRTMPYYTDPKAVNVQKSVAQVTPPDPHDADAGTTAILLNAEPPPTASEPAQWAPRVRPISPDEAIQILNNQLSRLQFVPQPDGSVVREYSTFSTVNNQSLKIYIDAGMNLSEIKFEANVKGDKHMKIQGLEEAQTLADVAPLKVTGKPAKVTMTKEQFEKLEGFYKAIAYPPKKVPATGQGRGEIR